MTLVVVGRLYEQQDAFTVELEGEGIEKKV